MSTIIVRPGALGAMIKGQAKKLPGAVRRGARVAAGRAQAHLKRNSPVDQGQFKNAWRVVDTTGGPEVVNDAPHAGIIELGARPHKVNAEGRKALLEWVLRVIQPEGGEPEAKGIVEAICAKLEKQGQRGTYLVKDNLEKIAAWAQEEIGRQVNRVVEAGDRG